MSHSLPACARSPHPTNFQLRSRQLKLLLLCAPAPVGGAEQRPGPTGGRSPHRLPDAVGVRGIDAQAGPAPALASSGNPFLSPRGSGPGCGEAGWAVDPSRRVIWAPGGEARGEGAAASVSAFRGPGSGKAEPATQPWREKRGAAGPGQGRGCGPALRPHSWLHPSRGPGARSAPPLSRRFLARVTPAEPRTRGWTRAGREALLLARRDCDPRLPWGRGQTRGSRGGEQRCRLRVLTPSFPPDAAPSPTARSHLSSPTGSGPLRTSGTWNSRRRGSAAYGRRDHHPGPWSVHTGCGLRGTGMRVPASMPGVGWSRLRPGGSSGVPPRRRARSRSRGHGSVAAAPSIAGPSGRDSRPSPRSS